MKSPELYSILKLTLNDFLTIEKKNIEYINKNGDKRTKVKNIYHLNNSLKFTYNDLKKYTVGQQYNQLFRIINNLGSIHDKFIEDVIFVDCKNNKNYEKQLEELLENGFKLNNKIYKFYGKSASMGRNGILGFLSEDVYANVNDRAMMDIKFDNGTVISKFEAYKHLLFSSCFCIEEELPYMIVVDDYDTVVNNVSIKYVGEIEKEYIDKKTEENKTFREKVILEGIKNIDNTVNDGAGLMSIEMAENIQKYLEIDYLPSIYMLRLPYVKGVSIVVDYKKFYKEKNIHKIKDIFGEYHNVDDIDIILTKSQYKGYKYFKQRNDFRDWLKYLDLLKKYDHCLGIAKWNYSHKDEPKVTRANYQILQTLDLETKDLIDMSSYTRRWIERILNGDLLYTYKYLGIGEESNPDNKFMKATLLNPYMINDIKIRSYLYGLLKNTINEIKIGKVHLKGAFKILCPDIVFMMEYIGGLIPVGCLKEGEMYAKDHKGEYVLNRNPHICKSEHVILNAVNDSLTKKWCGHLENVCMINSYDITAKRLNGADQDGDLVFVHNNPIFIKGINRKLPIVIDVDDKITAKEVKYNHKGLIEFTMKSLDSRIGEISNCASTYHNKYAKDEETRKKYDDYTCLLSVINGKEIDYAKTGLRWSVPRNISKNSKPLPYFLKYKYAQLNKFNMSKTKMNEHCWFIEKWQKKLRFNNDFINTSHCMIDDTIPFDEDKYITVCDVFKKFKSEFRELKNQEKMSKDYDRYKDFFDGLSKQDIENTHYNWDTLYGEYKKQLSAKIPNQAELANYVIELIYNKQHGMYYNFAWNIADEGILTNLRKNRIKPVLVPMESNDNTGEEYLGRYYKLVEYKGAI